MKKWFDVAVTRVVVKGTGESVRRNTQHAVVWATEQTALGVGFRRCPDPFEDEDRRRVTYCEVTELPENFDLQGRKMEEVIEEIDDGSAYGLSADDLAEMVEVNVDVEQGLLDQIAKA